MDAFPGLRVGLQSWAAEQPAPTPAPEPTHITVNATHLENQHTKIVLPDPSRIVKVHGREATGGVRIKHVNGATLVTYLNADGHPAAILPPGIAEIRAAKDGSLTITWCAQ